jgi:IclR family transcriptional regulator, mhp operon transcriptional activator
MEPKVISVLERGLHILNVLNRPGMSEVRHIHQATGLPKPTIVRLLDSLVGLGYVARRPGGGYALTAKVLALSHGYRSADPGQLLRAARPTLRWLRQQTAGWPSDLAICDAETMIVVDPGSGVGSQFLNRSSGYRLPIVGSALGRAYLAFCPPEERKEVLQRAAESVTQACNPETLLPILDSIRSKGFASRDCEHGKMTRVVAAPVLLQGRPIASISVVAAARAMTMQQMEKAFATPLAQAAASIAQAYGGGRS